MSKTEEILTKILNDEDLSNYVPQSELELWLKNIALGEGNENTPAKSRATKLLKQIALGGGGGGSGNNVISGIPIEISTEEEMNALLETSVIGTIYKYTGTSTESYENGALYVIEESE